MAEALQPCCQKARAALIARLTKGIASYPVIKDVPCPTCMRHAVKRRERPHVPIEEQ